APGGTSLLRSHPPRPERQPVEVLAQYVVSLVFQAEDGIRDSSVTGVQTCALPISRGSAAVPGTRLLACVASEDASKGGARKCGRSEERRVGKECRSRWSPLC